ncbi:MAG: hypothetical protein E7247_08830 [Paenibacillaceae bacterium]|nr:hypothetical protein [Paenibacillaceae bacterium]
MQGKQFESLKRFAQEYMRQYDEVYVTKYMERYCQKEIAAVLKQADLLLKQVFVFEDKWDMEPCSIPYALDPMVWDCSPNGDPEWIYMLNRHEYLHKLLLAYNFTKDIIYIEKLKWYLKHWISTNPIVSKGTETTRTIDTGIRCMNWQFLLIQMIGRELMDEDEAGVVLDSMSQQFHYMRNSYIEKYTLSNWGVLQTTAICQGYLWFKEYLPDNGMEQWAFNELEHQTQLQVLDDGSHWEQSIMYHIEVLLAFMKLFSNLEEGDWLLTVINSMSRYVLYSSAPDHCQIAQCDSDVTDVRDVLIKAAVFTGDGRYKYAGYHTMDLDSAWLLGQKGIRRYNELNAVKPQCRSFNGADSGNIYFRSGWEEDSHFTYLKCGALGSSHGHVDLTHISLYYKGKSFLIDSGRYSYREEEPLRVLLKSAQAHNVCVVDEEFPGKPISSWKYESFAQSMKNYYREEGPVHYGEMTCYGALSTGDQCMILRKVIAVDCGIWLIVNDICCTGVHKVKEYYHLDPSVRAVLSDLGGAGRQWELKNGNVKMNLWGSHSFQSYPCLISSRYNQLSDSTHLVRESGFTNRHTDWTCLSGSGVSLTDAVVFQTGNLKPADQETVTAKEFTLSEQESWILLIWNRETSSGGKLYYCQDTPIYGKAAAIHRKEGKSTLYRLRI